MVERLRRLPRMREVVSSNPTEGKFVFHNLLYLICGLDPKRKDYRAEMRMFTKKPIKLECGVDETNLNEMF